MTITSNISGVIRQVERLRTNVPIAAGRALQHADWKELATADAKGHLEILAEPHQRKYIDDFLKTVESAFASPQLFLTMKMPEMEQLEQESQSAIDRARLALASGGNPDWQDLKAAVLAWVETPVAQGGKRHDHRDSTKTDDEIADFLSFLITAPAGKLVGDRAVAGQAIYRRVVEFIFKAQITLPLEVVDLWLRTVLVAWRVMVVKNFPAKMRAELRAMKGEL